MFSKDNEEKRSQIWRITVVVATILIIVIASYLLHKMFTENPVTGTWVSQTRDLTLEIEEGGSVHLWGDMNTEDSEISYTIDKDNKRISFTLQVDEEVDLSEKVDEDEMISFTSTYTYSVDQEFLSLTDIEFGDVEYFIKE